MNQAKNSLRRRTAVAERDDYQCWYCGLELHLNIPEDDGSNDYWTHPLWTTYGTVDHLVPQSRGGTHDLTNLVFSCRSCNSRKKNRTLEELRTALSERRPEFQALLHLRWSRQLAPTPYDAVLATAEAWLEAQIQPFVFAGERTQI